MNTNQTPARSESGEALERAGQTSVKSAADTDRESTGATLSGGGRPSAPAPSFTREVRFHPGRDDRSGMRMAFILTGPLGAIEGVVNTGWNAAGNLTHRDFPEGRFVSSHVLPENATEHMMGRAKCDILPGGECDGDAGYLLGEDFLDALLAGGHDAAWTFLDGIYASWLAGESDD